MNVRVTAALAISLLSFPLLGWSSNVDLHIDSRLIPPAQSSLSALKRAAEAVNIEALEADSVQSRHLEEFREVLIQSVDAALEDLASKGDFPLSTNLHLIVSLRGITGLHASFTNAIIVTLLGDRPQHARVKRYLDSLNQAARAVSDAEDQIYRNAMANARMGDVLLRRCGTGETP